MTHQPAHADRYAHILGSQPTAGNRAVARKLQGHGYVSPKLMLRLAVSQPGDPFEQEADRVAEQVMRMPEPSVPIMQRQCI